LFLLPHILLILIFDF
jgi:cleavage and polyadenylation specificity factor subunit 3